MSMDNKKLIDLAAAEFDEDVCVCVVCEKQNAMPHAYNVEANKSGFTQCTHCTLE